MGLALLSYHANASFCSGATVPPQKPKKADEDQDRCHRDWVVSSLQDSVPQ